VQALVWGARQRVMQAERRGAYAMAGTGPKEKPERTNCMGQGGQGKVGRVRASGVRGAAKKNAVLALF